MTRWLGMTVSASEVIAVDLDVQDHGPAIIINDQTWSLQQGDRAEAYKRMFHRVADYITESSIERVAIKASALSQSGVKKAHLDAAELRGVVMAASAICPVASGQKAALSRNYGSRKVDDYLKDDAFWGNELNGTIRKGSREAAFVILAFAKN